MSKVMDALGAMFTEDIFQLLLDKKYKAAKAMMKKLVLILKMSIMQVFYFLVIGNLMMKIKNLMVMILMMTTLEHHKFQKINYTNNLLLD